MQGKFFYVRKNDMILLTIIENVLYLGFNLYSKLKIENNYRRDKKEEEIIENLHDIVGGIGLCNLKRNKKYYKSLKNCILLNCNENNLINTLKKSNIILYFKKNSIDYQNKLSKC